MADYGALFGVSEVTPAMIQQFRVCHTFSSMIGLGIWSQDEVNFTLTSVPAQPLVVFYPNIDEDSEWRTPDFDFY